MKRIHWKANGEGFVSPALSDKAAEELVKSLKGDPSVYEIEEEVIK